MVEAKKPAIDIDKDNDAIFYGKQYTWNSTIPSAILTDFEPFRRYGTTLKTIHAEPQRGLVKVFRIDYDQYESQWNSFSATFGREAAKRGR